MKNILLIICFVLGTMQLFAQNRTLKGIVTDKQGRPVSNASITIPGTAFGTQTDPDGTFTLTVPPRAKTVIISSVGLSQQEINIMDKTEITASLSVQDNEMVEAIVTGYLNIQKTTSPISSVLITSDKIKNVPVTNMNDILQGRAAGLTVMSTSGQPGATSNVRIRGTGSITAKASPIYVLDGIIIETGQVITGENSQSNDILSNLNPNDIESVTVLKDAAALALYGARGGNGVIVMTTKRGKAGESRLNFSTQYGSIFPSFGNWKMMDGKGVYDYERAVNLVNGASMQAVNADYPASLLNRSFDWVNAAFINGNTQNYNLSLSGGNEKSRHFLSLGFLQQDGILIRSDFKRITAVFNFDNQVSRNLLIGATFNTSFSNILNAETGNNFSSPIFASLANNPLFLYPYATDGTLYRGLEADYANNSVTGDNFLYSAKLNYNRDKQFRGLGRIYGELKITNRMTLKQTISTDLIYSREKIYVDPTTGNGINITDPTKSGNLYEELTNPVTFTSQTSLSGNFNMRDERHQLDYLAMTEYQRYNRSNFSAFGIGYPSGSLQVLDVASTPNDIGGTEEEYAFLSYLGMLNYSFDRKYALTASLRRDGSSRFGTNNRYALFYSAGGSWSIVSESFMKAQRLFGDLRLKASYGTSGVADFKNYQSLSSYAYNQTYNGASGSAPLTPGNPDLTWEKNKQLNIGLEFATFHNRLKGSVDYFHRISTDVLQDVPVSRTSGYTTSQQNVGEIKNQGFEISLNSANVKTRDFIWTSDLNISFVKNKVLKLYRGEDITTIGNRTSVGHPYNSWFLPVWAGVNPENGDPLWYLADGKTTTNSYAVANLTVNKKFLGSPFPDCTIGLLNTFTYKGFGLSFFLYSIRGSKVYDQNMSNIDSDGLRFGWNYYKDADKNFWTTPGQQAERPKPIWGGNKNSSLPSSRWLEKNDYVRLRNLTLSYNVTEDIIRKAGISKATFFVTGINLITWTNYKGVDPEVSLTGNDIFKYPPSRSLTVGIDISF